MKRFFAFMILLLLLAGCRSTPFDTHTVIDWVDFIKWEGREYNGIYRCFSRRRIFRRKGWRSEIPGYRQCHEPKLQN
ncbi:hypothetical protein DFO73_106198 [Cytobacillus oceanisediminis]|uniref:Lipoprotein n=1 Tax=Cytobacillus oceanisediminis TaxID=665099 RepID=A0A2V2ZVD8_9BACI|nr:hypothetical protein DFO73_106198 [Cytobacillus oceanisediminis]